MQSIHSKIKITNSSEMILEISFLEYYYQARLTINFNN